MSKWVLRKGCAKFSGKSKILRKVILETVRPTGGGGCNTDISGLYNTNILTAITPGTLKIEIDDMTAITPGTLKFSISKTFLRFLGTEWYNSENPLTKLPL